MTSLATLFNEQLFTHSRYLFVEWRILLADGRKDTCWLLIDTASPESYSVFGSWFWEGKEITSRRQYAGPLKWILAQMPEFTEQFSLSEHGGILISSWDQPQGDEGKAAVYMAAAGLKYSEHSLEELRSLASASIFDQAAKPRACRSGVPSWMARAFNRRTMKWCLIGMNVPPSYDVLSQILDDDIDLSIIESLDGKTRVERKVA